jgi:hypothetical protein
MSDHVQAASHQKCSCSCSSGLTTAYAAAVKAGLSRRHILAGLGATAVGSWVIATKSAAAQEAQAPAGPNIIPAKKLIVQPVLAYDIPVRREQTSWRHWGGIETEVQANEEVGRIEKELRQLAASCGLAVEFLPVAKVANQEQAAKAAQTSCDVRLIYASGGYALDPLVTKDRPTIFFLRHRSGPISLHYEVLHPIFLRNRTDHYAATGVDVHDVVVDEYDDLAWRLKALLSLRKTIGQRIVAIGQAAGWGAGHKLAPTIAREKWLLDIVEVSYDDLAKRIESQRKDSPKIADAKRRAGAYLQQPGVTLETDRAYVDNAFVLYDVFKQLMIEHEATAMTIVGCMGTVMPMSQTTACLPLSLLNDEGYLAFCESDFVVIPSGMLMHHIVGTPTFLNDPTWPHHGIVTLAHCTAPRRMNGKRDEPVRILTHFESDYGAAPKVEMSKGEVVTMVIPDFECKKWVGAGGKIEAAPFHAICRSQVDVAIDGDWGKLLEDMRGFHWMMTYGDCRREVGYAIKHLGIDWLDVSKT